MTRPLMPYTRGLLDAVPSLDIPESFEPLPSIRGMVPSPDALPPGCPFAPRCDFFRSGLCDAAVPPLETATAGHDVRCLRWREILEEVSA